VKRESIVPRLLLILLFAAAGARAQEAAPPAPPATWSGNFAFGLSLTRGNSDTKNINLTAAVAQRIDRWNVAKYDAFYLRADSGGALTVDRTLVGARDEYTISPLTYAFGDIHFLRDRFKEIDSLITPTVGAGHHLIKTDPTDLAVEAGVGAVVERDTGRPSETSGAITAKQLFTHKISSTATIGETASGLWKTKSLGDALYHVEASMAGNLTTRTQMKLSALDDYNTRPPAPGIKKNDVSIIAAIVMKF
jgi:putative salt-induced outer membrane protein YdiY